MIDLDPPKHTEMRRLAMSGFTNSALSSWQPIIQETTNSFLDKVQDKGSMDIVYDLSAQLPSTIISNIFGVPESLRSKFIQWVTDIATFAGSPSSENIEEIARNADIGAASFTALIEELISERRSNPKTDMISLLVKAYEEEKRNTEEIPALCVLILLAGHVTSVDLIPNGVNALLNHPEQLLLLKENPEFIGSAVEEMIRYDTPGQIAFRLATEDIIIDTKKIPSGSMVGLCMAAANHDPEKFKAPHEFNIKRSNNEHLGFAKGIHFCLGIILARMELAICFNTLLKRMPLISFDLSRPPVRKRDSIVFSGFESLYVNF